MRLVKKHKINIRRAFQVNAKDERILAQRQEDLKLRMDRKRVEKMEDRLRRTVPAFRFAKRFWGLKPGAMAAGLGHACIEFFDRICRIDGSLPAGAGVVFRRPF